MNVILVSLFLLTFMLAPFIAAAIFIALYSRVHRIMQKRNTFSTSESKRYYFYFLTLIAFDVLIGTVLNYGGYGGILQTLIVPHTPGMSVAFGDPGFLIESLFFGFKLSIVYAWFLALGLAFSKPRTELMNSLPSRK